MLSKNEEKKAEEEKKKKKKAEKKTPVLGTVPPCKPTDCPLKFPHSKGIYLHEGKSATKYWETPFFGKANPPLGMKCAGTKKDIPVPQSVPPPSMREGSGRGGSAWANSMYWDSRGPREMIVEVYDRKQEAFLEYQRGCTCAQCKCSNLGGCNCLWTGGCMDTVRFE